MKRLIAGAALTILAGCVMNPYDQTGLSSQTITTSIGEQDSVDNLKQRYFSKVGKSLTEPNALTLCQQDANCYYRKWHDMYLSSMQIYDREQAAIQSARRAAEADMACMKDVACRTNKLNEQRRNHLRSLYTRVTYSASSNVAEGDGIFRNICSAATSAQKRGVPQREVVNTAEDMPGVAPYFRGTLVDTVTECWQASKAGVNWQQAIRPLRIR